MIEQYIPNHHIQKHIITTLIHNEFARFKEMKPTKVDTNLYTYHLKVLIKQKLVKKIDNVYTLSQNGLLYVDRVNAEKVFIRNQPKIITMLLIQDGYGKVLVQKRTKQPYINTWTLPYGKLHIDDRSLIDAAKREAREKLQTSFEVIRHVGDCYIRVMARDVPVSATLVHLFRAESDALNETEYLQWIEPLDLPKLRLAPAIEQIVARSFFGDEHFFEEFIVDERSMMFADVI